MKAKDLEEFFNEHPRKELHFVDGSNNQEFKFVYAYLSPLRDRVIIDIEPILQSPTCTPAMAGI